MRMAIRGIGSAMVSATRCVTCNVVNPHSVIYNNTHSGGYFGRFEHIYVEMNKHMLSTNAFYSSQQFVAVLPCILHRKVAYAVLLLLLFHRVPNRVSPRIEERHLKQTSLCFKCRFCQYRLPTLYRSTAFVILLQHLFQIRSLIEDFPSKLRVGDNFSVTVVLQGTGTDIQPLAHFLTRKEIYSLQRLLCSLPVVTVWMIPTKNMLVTALSATPVNALTSVSTLAGSACAPNGHRARTLL